MGRSPGAGDIDATVHRREDLTMRRIPTMIASASAAALTTLAVTVAVPAIGDDGTDTKSGGDGLAACLREHGLDGAPDDAALKPWLAERLQRGDATTDRALQECSPEKALVAAGPTEAELRSCLKDHRVDVPGDDAMALKRWLADHADDDSYRDALRACGLSSATKPEVAVACAKDGAVTAGKATAARRATKVLRVRR
jgi:hypothetical protein